MTMTMIMTMIIYDEYDYVKLCDWEAIKPLP